MSRLISRRSFSRRSMRLANSASSMTSETVENSESTDSSSLDGGERGGFGTQKAFVKE